MNTYLEEKIKKDDKFKRLANDLSPIRRDHWENLYLQSSIPLNLADVFSVIDFGSGRNLSKSIVEHFGMKYSTVDVVDDYNPDFISPIKYNISGLNKADFVGCYQCLEHNAFEEFADLLTILSSYSNKYVCISLPYDGAYFSLKLSLRFPLVRKRLSLFLNKCGFAGRDIFIEKEKLEKEPYRHHRWEVGRPSFPIKKIIKVAEDKAGLKLSKIDFNKIYASHIFFLFTKKGN